MPFYTWRGITIDGNDCKGSLFAVSKERLDEHLFAQKIALISCSQTDSWFSRSVTQATKINFFNELSILLDSGILLPDALVLLGGQFPQRELQEIIQYLISHVSEGEPLYEAMKQYPHFFDLFMIQMVHIGYASGNLQQSLSLLSEHLQTGQDFNKTLRSLLVGPASTFIFFLIIAFAIFFFIVPHFASLLASTDKPLPVATQYMFSISSFISSFAFPLIILATLLSVLITRRWYGTKIGKRALSSALLRLPFFGPLLRDQLLAHFFQSLHLLLEGGEQLLDSLQVTQVSMQESLLAPYITLLVSKVSSGHSLGLALYTSDFSFFDHDIVAMITVGLQAGCLPQMARRVGSIYTNRVLRRFSLASRIFQPMLLLILGILVTLLVLCVYVPLFTLAETIAF